LSEIEKFNLISNIFFIAAVVLLLLAIVLFFVFDIKKIFMDLTGITEKRAIKRIALENANKRDSANQSTDKITASGKIQRSTTEGFGDIPITSDLNNNETTLLVDYNNETTLLSTGNNETTVLSENTNETTVLYTPVEEMYNSTPMKMVIVQDIMFINTDKIINVNC